MSCFWHINGNIIYQELPRGRCNPHMSHSPTVVHAFSDFWICNGKVDNLLVHLNIKLPFHIQDCVNISQEKWCDSCFHGSFWYRIEVLKICSDMLYKENFRCHHQTYFIASLTRCMSNYLLLIVINLKKILKLRLKC